MNLDSLSLALAGICNSVANLTKKNSKQSVTEINHLVSQHGAEAERHLFRCLFSHVDFSGDGKSSGKDFHQTQLLIQEFGSLFTKPNFVSILCFALDNPLQHQKSLEPSPHLFTQLSKVLKLNRVQEVVFGLVLLNSTRSDTRAYALQFVKQKLPDLLRSYVDADTSSHQEVGLLDTSVEVLHVLLSYLVPDKDVFGIGADQKSAFIRTLRRDFPRERVPAVLSPLLYPDNNDIPFEKLLDLSSVPTSIMETSLADIILESGCSSTASLEDCRNTLKMYAQRDLTAKNVAQTLGMMARLPNGASDQHPQGPGGHHEKDTPGVNFWNTDNFVQAVRDLNPGLQWREVVANLDHPSFIVPNKRSLKLLMHALFKGLQGPFPVELVFRPWSNSEGQMSFIMQCIASPEIFSLADNPVDTVVFDILKSAPNEDDRDVAIWKSLSLVECLLRLSEVGHYQQVMDIFKGPTNKCPDLLVLALLQTPPNWNTLKQELISMLMPIFLGSHANSAIVLHYAWHHQGHSSTIRTLIMHAMAEWYMRGEPHDQTRLSRILDVAQDLKALSMLLNATPFAFVIDLACLASRREYLKLDKWLSDKIQEHKEPFIQACVTFLKRRCPQLIGGKEEPQAKSQQLPLETISCMLSCLKNAASGVTQELAEAVSTMYTNASVLFNKPRIPPGVVGAPAPSAANPPSFPGNMATPPGPLNAMSAMPPGKAPNFPTNPMVNSPKPPHPAGGPVAPVGPSKPQMPNVVLPLQLDSLGSIGHPVPPQSGASTFPPSLPGGLGAGPPGSPSKGYPVMSQPNAPGPPVSGPPGHPGPPGPFSSHMPNLTSQFQNMSLQQPTVTSAIGQQRNPVNSMASVNSLASLSAQVASKQPTPPGGSGARSGANFAQSQMSQQAFSSSSGGDMSSIFPEMTQQFPKEVEDKANSYFQQIFNQPPHPTMSIDEVLDMLKNFKDSSNKMEKDVFACMLRNLFEEYRFFPQYPERELITTAMLFGGIIEQGIVTYWTLGIALRYILEALRKPPNSKMYCFGVTALDRFKTKLKDYPQYCQHLAAIPHFSNFPAHLIDYIECGSRSMEPPQSAVASESATPTTMMGLGPPRSLSTPMEAGAASAPSSTPTPASNVATRALQAGPKPSIATATNIDTLLAGQTKEEVAIPPEPLQDKVFFIFNNLSLANMNQKAGELKAEMENYVPWVAQYLVMKRASIEPNFHTLYSNFIDVLDIEDFPVMVIKETYRNIKVLLRSDKGVANFSDRTLLKNLGHWLGMLTLAKNKPILQIDIDLKALLYEAYSKGSQELLYVVPFTAKVLESAAKSKVFRPPNPWTMAIMNVLAELHQEPDLKLNLKFEIEVLCKTLTLTMDGLSPTNYLKDTSRMHMIESQLSAPGKAPPVPAGPTPPQPEDVPVPPQVPPVPPGPGPMGPPPLPQAPPGHAPLPLFSYDSINIGAISNVGPHVHISENIPFFGQHPQLKALVRPAIERAINELIQPVVDRSIKIALTTCEQIIKKDFALDPNEDRMSTAAHCMIRNITAGLALITCREPLYMTIANNLKNSFAQHFRNGLPPAMKPMLEEAANIVAQDNTELASVFIQKTAVERGIPEIDKRLSPEYDLRKHARAENRRYCDPGVLTYQAERMPEQIQLKVGTVTLQHMSVYDEFARNIPGFLPMSEGLPFSKPQPTPSLPPQQPPPRPPPQQPPPQQTPMYHTDEFAGLYERLMHEIEQSLGLPNIPPTSALGSQLHSLMDAIMNARNSRDLHSAVVLVQKAVEGVLDQYAITGLGTEEIMRRFKECHLMVLKAMGDARFYGPQWVKAEVTKCLTQCRDEFKFNVEGLSMLIRSGFVSLQQYDSHLVSLLENGLNQMAVNHITALLTQLIMDEKFNNQVSEADFPSTIEALQNVSRRQQPNEGLAGLIDSMRPSNDQSMAHTATMGPTTMMQSGIAQAREFDDPPGLHEKTEYLLREWVNMYHSPAAGRDSTKAFSAFVQQMHQQGILKTDDLITRFFRLCTEMCVDLCYRALNEQSQSPTLVRAKCFHTLDAFVRLIALLVKHSGDTSNTVTKINLLNKVLGIVAGVLLQDHEVRYTEFQQLPYHRIFIMLFIELNAPEAILETINFQVLAAFCHVFHVLRPSKAPGFAYAWLELVSHRVFIGRLLALTPQQRGWGLYGQLLIDLFKFLSPFLRNAELTKPAQLLYKGTLRVLLVLLHDFPEFLCEYHYSFCDVIPPNCIQMRNIILSAFPRNMRLPDPFTPNLKVDSLPDIAQAPRINFNYAQTIQPASFKKDLESYLKSRNPISFLSELRSNLQRDKTDIGVVVLQSTEAGCHYNIPLINALVLYVGTQAIQHIHSKSQTPNMSTIAPSPHMDIFQNLAVNLDTEGRYLFLTAIANQLRYPNSHTHYFSCTLLYLFAQANTETIQEQITRVLLERLIVNRPHPWGLLITFIELIKNPTYKFWTHEFVHCAPEIEKLFESVARSCMQAKQNSLREQEATEGHH